MFHLPIKILYMLILSSNALAVITISAIKKHNDLIKKNHSLRNSSLNDFFDDNLPIVINTWPFVEAGEKGMFEVS